MSGTMFRCVAALIGIHEYTQSQLYNLMYSYNSAVLYARVSIVALFCLNRKAQKKANPKKAKAVGGVTPKPPSESAMVFKTYDKSSGVTLRSSKTKFPLTLGQRKTKAIEQLLEELGVGE